MRRELEKQYTELRGRLRRLLWLRRMVRAARGAGLTVLGVGLVLGGAMVADHLLHLPLWVRLPLAPLFYALLVWLAWRLVVAGIRLAGDLRRVALRVESRHGGMDQSVVGTVQFGPGQTRTKAAPDVFVEGMVRAAHGHVDEIRASDVVRPGETMVAVGLLAAAVGLLAAAVGLFPQHTVRYAGRLLLPGVLPIDPVAKVHMTVEPGDVRVMENDPVTLTVRVREPGIGEVELLRRVRGDRRWVIEPVAVGSDGAGTWALRHAKHGFAYRFRSGRDTTPVYDVDVINLPEIVGFRMTYTPPAYAGLSNRVVASAAGDITALRGTTVRVDVLCDGAIARATVEVEGAEPRAALPFGDLGFYFDWQVDDAARYRLRFEDDAGTKGESPVSYVVTPLIDQPPTVELVSPEDNVRATSVSEVPVVFHVKDDYGFSVVRMRYLVDDRQEESVLLDPAGRRDWESEYRFELETMGLRPGSEVLFSIEVLDNDAWAVERLGAPNRAVSQMMFILVGHFAQEFMMVTGEGGGAPKKPKEDLVAIQRAIVRRTWPMVDARELDAQARLELAEIGRDQRLLRAKVDRAVSEMRHKGVRADAIAAYEKAGAIMDRAAARLEAAAANDAFEQERLALAALLEATAYAVAILEMGSGSGGGEGAEPEERLEEVDVKASSRFSSEPEKRPSRVAEDLGLAVARLRQRQQEIAREAGPPQPPQPGQPADAQGSNDAQQQQQQQQDAARQADQDAHARQERADRLSREQRALGEQTAALSEKVRREAARAAAQQPAEQETLQQVAEALDGGVEQMQQAAEALEHAGIDAEARDAARRAEEWLDRAGEAAARLEPSEEAQLQRMAEQVEQMQAAIEAARLDENPADAARRIEDAARALEDLADRARNLRSASPMAEAMRQAAARMAQAADAQQQGAQPGQGSPEQAEAAEGEQPGGAGNPEGRDEGAEGGGQGQSPPSPEMGGRNRGEAGQGGKGGEGEPDPDEKPGVHSSERTPGSGAASGGVGGGSQGFGHDPVEEAARVLEELAEAFEEQPALRERREAGLGWNDTDSAMWREQQERFFRAASDDAAAPTSSGASEAEPSGE